MQLLFSPAALSTWLHWYVHQAKPARLILVPEGACKHGASRPCLMLSECSIILLNA
jgi:hypothetical protein